MNKHFDKKNSKIVTLIALLTYLEENNILITIKYFIKLLNIATYFFFYVFSNYFGSLRER